MKRPTLRRSQTISVFGVGAIVDLPDLSVMVCSIDNWNTQGAPHLTDPRLERKLGAPYFVMPPDVNQSRDGLKAVIFPRWMRCRKCGFLRDLNDWRTLSEKSWPERDFFRKPFCDQCSVPLIPSRFVVACRKGHIDDFPYHEWIGHEPTCVNPQLRYTESGKSASLDSIRISCSVCKASRTMRGAFNKNLLANASQCKGMKPWTLKTGEGCGEALHGLLRGGTNVHYPIVKSSILIPPFTSENIKTKITSTKIWPYYESQKGAFDIFQLAPQIAEEIGESSERVVEAINEMEKGFEDDMDVRTEEQYRFDEYRAFTGEVVKQKDFEILPISGNKYNIPFIRKIVLAKKLREIRVQTGFARIRPPDHSENPDISDSEEKTEEVSVSDDRKIKWKPGFEVRGEGIFLDIDPKILELWSSSQSVQDRSQPILKRFKKLGDVFSTIDSLSPEYIFLHSLSHMLIRQLSFDCGYGSSALRERIYCSSPESENKMYGILIYTADGDSEGTLGGLVKQGNPEFFTKTLYEAVINAKWCSSDPLCIESKGQGYQSLNLAACHACAMLPETSCEIMNRYLDRGSVIGSLDNPSIGFLSEWVSSLVS